MRGGEAVKAKRKRIIVAAVVLVLAAAWLWYTRPMSLEKLCPGIDLSECTEIKGSYSPPNSNSVSFSLTPEDAGFESLLEQFRDRTFSRTVRGLLLAGRTKTHIGWSPEDTEWYVSLCFDTVTLPDGEEIRGDLVRFDNFYGSVNLRYAGAAGWDEISTPGKQRWLADVQAIVSGE